MKTYIGVDLGGTNVRVARVDDAGNILEEYKAPSYAQNGPQAVMDHLMTLLERLSDVSACAGIGIGVPGPVDVRRGVMRMSTNLPGFTDYPIASEISDRFGIPCFMDNDANVAGLAEALVGAGAGREVVYYITHSTGIGGALIVNGQVVSGRHGYAGEIANIVIDRHLPKRNHLVAGAVENEASGLAIGRIGAQQIGPQADTAQAVFDLAAQGNQVAITIINQMAYDFAQMCATIAHVVDPDCFVIGGGVSHSWELYWPQMTEYYYSLVHEGMREMDFFRAGLAEPGIIGAAMLPKSKGV